MSSTLASLLAQEGSFIVRHVSYRSSYGLLMNSKAASKR